MKFLLFAGFLVVSSFCAPSHRDESDECGAVDLKNVVASKGYVPPSNAGVTCEICLDLVLIAETYAECEEATVQHRLDKYCKAKYSNKISQQACLLMVNDVAHVVIDDTNQDPSAVCKDLVHKDCHYGLKN
ncbi:unnamed protein product [Caenorhabditis bovis]|uniref:Saposin B-type domain-containing protein n=1 Tax=Caenorhabditis bovis TaxID=2654633 RepID=A0A8S1EEE5_9PELO|nr:unnamed protein product [Caenorhabditis bovis]